MGAAMAHPEQDCERRCQAAVSVVHSLPKNDVYRPSHEVMLRFYSFYKQATCGPCTAPRPGFWDPIGRYKWDAWKRLGGTSREGAMREYVEEMKRVALEVIDTVPMNEKTASMFHYFQPLYRVIHDMPRPPDTLLQQTGGELENSVREESSGESEPQGNGPVWGLSGHPDGGAEFNQESNHVTSDSESEVFCDSMEQLDPNKQGEPQSDSSAPELQSPLNPVAAATQAGAGQGGERAGQGEGEPLRKKGVLLDGRQSHWSERHWRSSGDVARDERGVAGAGGGAGGGAPERGHPGALEQQITLALQRLQEDMHCARDRLHALEQRADMQQGLSWWLPALLLWPFLAQWLIHLLQCGRKKM